MLICKHQQKSCNFTRLNKFVYEVTYILLVLFVIINARMSASLNTHNLLVLAPLLSILL